MMRRSSLKSGTYHMYTCVCVFVEGWVGAIELGNDFSRSERLRFLDIYVGYQETRNVVLGKKNDPGTAAGRTALFHLDCELFHSHELSL